MIKLIYGYGTIHTQQGTIAGEGKCITITDTGRPRPVGATAKSWPDKVAQEEHDIVLVFTSLESLRTLQDEICELAATWSRELSAKIELLPTDPGGQETSQTTTE